MLIATHAVMWQKCVSHHVQEWFGECVVIKYMSGLALCAVFSTTIANAQEAVTWEENVQGWRVAIDRTINNSCFIFSSFGKEQYVRLQLNSVQQKVQLIVASLDWASLKTGEDYNVELFLDDIKGSAQTAKGHRWKDILPSLVLSYPFAEKDTSLFMKDFSTTDKIRLTYGGAEIANLDMKGADQAIAAMLECQAEMIEANKATPSDEDPFLTKPDQSL